MERECYEDRVLTPDEEVQFSCPVSELSCIVGNLFAGLELPCEEIAGATGLVISGETFSGRQATLTIGPEKFVFVGCVEDLKAVRESICLGRKCSCG